MVTRLRVVNKKGGVFLLNWTSEVFQRIRPEIRPVEE